MRILDGSGRLFAYRSDRPGLSEQALAELRVGVPRFVETCLKKWKIEGNSQRGEHFFSILGLDRQGGKEVSLVRHCAGGYLHWVGSDQGGFPQQTRGGVQHAT